MSQNVVGNGFNLREQLEAPRLFQNVLRNLSLQIIHRQQEYIRDFSFDDPKSLHSLIPVSRGPCQDHYRIVHPLYHPLLHNGRVNLYEASVHLCFEVLEAASHCRFELANKSLSVFYVRRVDRIMLSSHLRLELLPQILEVPVSGEDLGLKLLQVADLLLHRNVCVLELLDLFKGRVHSLLQDLYLTDFDVDHLVQSGPVLLNGRP